MNDLVVTNVRVLQPGEGLVAAWVRIREGKIAELGPRERLPRDASECVDGAGRLLTPGLIDIHTHGIERFGYEGGPEQIIEAAQRLGQYGTTCVLPTLYQVIGADMWLSGKVAADMSTRHVAERRVAYLDIRE